MHAQHHIRPASAQQCFRIGLPPPRQHTGIHDPFTVDPCTTLQPTTQQHHPGPTQPAKPEDTQWDAPDAQPGCRTAQQVDILC